MIVLSSLSSRAHVERMNPSAEVERAAQNAEEDDNNEEEGDNQDETAENNEEYGGKENSEDGDQEEGDNQEENVDGGFWGGILSFLGGIFTIFHCKM